MKLGKKIASIALSAIAVVGLCFGLAACGNSLVDYSEGQTPSEGLEYHHISELESGAFSLNFKDYVDGDDYYVVTGIGSCKDKVIVVPAEYNGKPVKAVADRAFFQAEGVEGFIFSNNMQSIGQLAIRGTGLKVLKGNGIRCYGDGCTGGSTIKDLVLSQSTEYIAQWAFFFSPDAKTIWIPKTVKKIGPQPFMDSGYEKIYYEGSEDDWKKIEFEAGEQDFDIAIDYNVAYPGIK